MAQTTLLVKIEDWLENGIARLERKLPSWVTTAAEKAVQYVSLTETYLNSNVALDVAPLIPGGETAREDIIGILTTMQKAFQAVDASLRPGIISAAGAQVTATLAGQPVSRQAALTAFTAAQTRAQTND